MERDKHFFRCLFLHYFDLSKTAAQTHRILLDTYSERAPSEQTVRDWFQRFKTGDFDLKDKERSGGPRKFDDTELKALLDENPACTLKELAEVLDVEKSTIGKRLQAMGMIQVNGKWISPDVSKPLVKKRKS